MFSNNSANRDEEDVHRPLHLRRPAGPTPISVSVPWGRTSASATLAGQEISVTFRQLFDACPTSRPWASPTACSPRSSTGSSTWTASSRRRPPRPELLLLAAVGPAGTEILGRRVFFCRYTYVAPWSGVPPAYYLPSRPPRTGILILPRRSGMTSQDSRFRGVSASRALQRHTPRVPACRVTLTRRSFRLRDFVVGGECPWAPDRGRATIEVDGDADRLRHLLTAHAASCGAVGVGDDAPVALAGDRDRKGDQLFGRDGQRAGLHDRVAEAEVIGVHDLGDQLAACGGRRRSSWIWWYVACSMPHAGTPVVRRRPPTWVRVSGLPRPPTWRRAASSIHSCSCCETSRTHQASASLRLRALYTGVDQRVEHARIVEDVAGSSRARPSS